MNKNRYTKVIKSRANDDVRVEILDHHGRIVESRVFDVRIESLPLWRGMFCSKESNKEYLFKAAHKYADKIIELCLKYETDVDIENEIIGAPGDE